MAAMPADPPRNALIPPTPEERENQRQEIVAFRAQLLARADDLFAAILIAFGDEQGRLLWRNKLKRKRGRKPGPTMPVQDRYLLKIYDAFAAEGQHDTKRLPGLISELVKAHPDPHLGDTSMVTAEAIEQRLRRALKRRRKDRRENPLTANGNK
jgi:hypothetical protein